jgi:hypothetical protein
VYRVLRESGAQTRLDVVATRGLTLLVGREQEVGLLAERWGRAAEGMGQVVVLTGEAGIGKSRLVQVLRDQLAGISATRIECRCSPHTQHSALYPIIAHLERALAFTRNDAPPDKLHKLEDALAPYAVPLSDLAPPIRSTALTAAASALSVAHPHPPTAAPKNAGSPTHLAVAGGGQAPGAVYRRRPALGGSLDARVPRSPRGSEPNRSDHGPLDLPPGIYATLAEPSPSHATHPHTPA